MSIISVEVEKTSEVKMLVAWLKAIKFVKDVSVIDNSKASSNVFDIQQILSDIEEGQLFTNISNPSEYQKQLRNEW